MRRMMATMLLAVTLAIGASGCSAQTVQIWWNANGGASHPLSTDVAQAIADRINETCHPSYWPCLPYAGDLDCADVGRFVFVIGPDDYRLDGDGDGVGCE